MAKTRSPGMKLLLAGVVAVLLAVPLMLVYALVYDRESQSERAQSQISAGWGGPQVVTGPQLVIPYTREVSRTETVNGQSRVVTSRVRHELYVSPTEQTLKTDIAPDRRGYAIYESVVYEAGMEGKARFALTEEFDELDIPRESLLLDEAELRFGISDPLGLRNDEVRAGGESLRLSPGNGPRVTGGQGFSARLEWDAEAPLDVAWNYGVRGSRSLALVPRGGTTTWEVTSDWPHPSFLGRIVPDEREISSEGFTATYAGLSNRSLGQRLITLDDTSGAAAAEAAMMVEDAMYDRGAPIHESGANAIATIGLVDPVDLYSQVDRAVKYGFLFIGFTFAMFLMFDIVGGARVAVAEYLLTGAGLVLFFVMLLAFAEVVGFALAYVLAAAAIIGLLTAYSAAVLGGWRRASFVGGMLAGLYALLYVLLNLETYSLVIGSLLLFAALAGIMYATRNVDWSEVNPRKDEGEGEGYAPSA